MNYYEWIGYTGSVLVAVSLMMKNIYYLRQINLVGASTFAFYGYLVKAYPVVTLNGFIAIVDVIYLIQMHRSKEAFSLLPINEAASEYLKRFLEFHAAEIQKFSPEFKMSDLQNAERFFVLRNMMPVGVIIFEHISKDEVLIKLDYAIPDYRDFKNGRFVVQTQSQLLKKQGVKKMIAYSGVPVHQKYLKRIGFRQVDKNRFEYQL